MNRREFLQRLLEQTDYSQYPNKKDDIEFLSPPTTVKRMQIMQLGCPRIKVPSNNKQEQPLVILKSNIKQSEEKPLFQSETTQKINVHVNANNKRVFVLQKIKHERKKKDSEKKVNERHVDKEAGNYGIKNNPDITQQINNCLARERVSIDSISLNNQTPAQNTRGLHIKTSSESQVHRATSYNRKDLFGTQQKKCLRQGSDSVIKPQQAETKETQEKTNRSEAKSMFIKSTQYSSNSSFGPRKQRTVFRHKQLISCENQNDKQLRQKKMTMRRQLHKNYTKQFSAPPKITAKCYIVIERLRPGNTIENKSNIIISNVDSKLNHKIHASFNSKSCVQVASLTKIMTCIVAIQLCLQYRLDSHTEIIKIGKFQSNIGGTSAKIQQGDIYSLHDLFHGLMLPSGNDASLAIAVWGGKVLYGNGETGNAQVNLEMLHSERTKKGKKLVKKTKYYEKFLAQMNKKAKELKLVKTNYANSHGLINNMNKSCAYDISVLSLYAMQNQYFRQIVSTKTYSNTIQHQQKVLKKSSQTTISTVKRNLLNTSSSKLSFKNPNQMLNVEEKKQFEKQQSQNEEDEEESSLGQREISVVDNQESDQYQTVISTRQVYWQNTHKLLHKPNTKYIGIKTGVTTAAGPCLSSCIRTECGRQFYIVVLNCKKMLLRFKDTEILRKWIFKQENLYKIKAKGQSVKSYSCVDSQFENDEEDNQLDED